jgi:hypothetical protein
VVTRRKAAEMAAKFAMSELAVIADREAKYGRDEDWPTGTVFRFERTYEVNGKSYSFAALKVIGGLWYLTKSTHSRVASPVDWDALMDFLEDGVTVQVATHWEDVSEVVGD